MIEYQTTEARQALEATLLENNAFVENEDQRLRGSWIFLYDSLSVLTF